MGREAHVFGVTTSQKKEYECLSCGEITAREQHPIDCPVCGGGLQGRAMSLE